MAASLGDRVLYVATAREAADDPELLRRILRHRDRRPAGWETLELGGGPLDELPEKVVGFDAVLLDSLTLWAAARMAAAGDGEVLEELGRFLVGATASPVPMILVSDEVGLGVVPGSAAGRRFRDLLGLANQRVAAAAREVYLCVAGVGLRVK